MFAPALPEYEASTDALLTYPSENRHRLVSLWNIVNQFNAPRIMFALQLVSSIEAQMRLLMNLGMGNQSPDEERLGKIIYNVKFLRGECAAFPDACQTIDLVLSRLESQQRVDSSSLCTELRHVCEAVVKESGKHRFLRVLADRAKYIDQDALFGVPVKLAFPSASRDIREAGNCLAAECGTGAVFHAMRAAEIALRALASDRRVQYPDASLKTRQVGDLLSALDGKLADMRKADVKLWPNKDIKDAQIRFYHAAIAEFRDFNEAWRKHMAHAHEGAFYDSLQAQSILNHVGTFLMALSDKISESSATPLYWTSA